MTAPRRAADSLIAAYVASPDIRRRLEHAVRLLALNGHDDSAESLAILVELSRPVAQAEDAAS